MARRPRGGLSGHDAVIRNLRKLRTVPSSVADKAARDSLEPMRAATAANARKLRRTHLGRPPGGHLDQGFVVRKKSASQYAREFWVAATRRARYIAHLVEFGTSPHWQPRRGQMHPGARQSPMMRPAFEDHAEEVPRRIGKSIWAAIAAAIAGVK